MSFFNLCGGITSTTIPGDIVPPPPPGGGTAYLSQISDFDWLHWEPTAAGNPPVPENSSFHTISTPSGPGFEFVCTDANETNWNSNARAVLAMKSNTTTLGQTQDWTWDMYLPSQTINVTQYVLWEFHTNSSSGHFIGINTDKTYRVVRQSAYGENYQIIGSGGVPVVFDAWHPCRMQIKWSLGGDGFVRIWVNNVQQMNFTGPSQFSGDGQPYLQFGWYGYRPAGVTNIVRYANIQRALS